ncbi:putative integral membrane protein [Pseudonocardia sp. N23]|nr:putative integral membrane protein [Pseudonocardia sp. N23]
MIVMSAQAPPSTTGTPLLPTGLRRPAAVATALCAALLVTLAVLVDHTAVPTSFDAWVQQSVAGHRVLRGRWPNLAVAAGEPITVIAVAVVAAAWCARRRQWRLAVLAVSGPGLTGLAETVLKPLVGRTIPTGELAFPSGHTAGATAMALTLTFVVAGMVRQRRELVVGAGALVTVVVAGVVAVGLVAEHAHYPTDTIGGFCLAVVVTLTAAYAVDHVRRPVTQGVGRHTDD